MIDVKSIIELYDKGERTIESDYDAFCDLFKIGRLDIIKWLYDMKKYDINVIVLNNIHYINQFDIIKWLLEIDIDIDKKSLLLERSIQNIQDNYYIKLLIQNMDPSEIKIIAQYLTSKYVQCSVESLECTIKKINGIFDDLENIDVKSMIDLILYLQICFLHD